MRLSEDAPVIGMVGRLAPSKGQFELLRAFPRVLSTFSDATLLIVGAPAFNQEHKYRVIISVDSLFPIPDDTSQHEFWLPQVGQLVIAPSLSQ